MIRTTSQLVPSCFGAIKGQCEWPSQDCFIRGAYVWANIVKNTISPTSKNAIDTLLCVPDLQTFPQLYPRCQHGSSSKHEVELKVPNIAGFKCSVGSVGFCPNETNARVDNGTLRRACLINTYKKQWILRNSKNWVTFPVPRHTLTNNKEDNFTARNKADLYNHSSAIKRAWFTADKKFSAKGSNYTFV